MILAGKRLDLRVMGSGRKHFISLISAPKKEQRERRDNSRKTPEGGPIVPAWHGMEINALGCRDSAFIPFVKVQLREGCTPQRHLAGSVLEVAGPVRGGRERSGPAKLRGRAWPVPGKNSTE